MPHRPARWQQGECGGVQGERGRDDGVRRWTGWTCPPSPRRGGREKEDGRKARPDGQGGLVTALLPQDCHMGRCILNVLIDELVL